MLTDSILLHSVIYCVLCTAILAMMCGWPRAMLQKYPKAIQDAVAPKTDEEKKLTLLFGFLILVVMLLYPVASLYYITGGQHLTFANIFIYIWSLMLAFNIYDLLILDWLIFCTITPKFILIPGTEGNAGYKDYWFHFIGFLKGLVITFVLSLGLSIIGYFICK